MDDHNNLNTNKNNLHKQTKKIGSLGWYNSIWRKIIRRIALFCIFIVIVLASFVVSLPLINWSFLNVYINDYVNTHTNLIFHIKGEVRLQVLPKFQFYVEDLTFKQKQKKDLSSASNTKTTPLKNTHYNKNKRDLKKHSHSFLPPKDHIQQQGIFYKSKHLKIIMPIGKMLRTDFTVDEISASEFKVGYDNYKIAFSPLSIQHINDDFKMEANGNGQVNTAKTLFQAKFSSLSPHSIKGDLHIAINNIDMKLRIDKYAIGEPLQAYVDINSNDLYNLVHLWGFHYHTKKWGLKGDITLNFQELNQEDISNELNKINNNLTQIAQQEKNKINISRSVVEQELEKKPNMIVNLLGSLDNKLDNKKDNNSNNKTELNKSDHGHDHGNLKKDKVQNLIISSKQLQVYYTSLQGFEAKGILTNTVYDLSGRTTHSIGHFTGYKGGHLRAEILSGGGLHMPMIIQANLQGNDFNEILGVVGYPYHSKKFRMKARVILKYGAKRRSGVYVDHIISNYTSISHGNGNLTGNFFYGWYKGELYADALVNNNGNSAKAKIYIKKYHDPLIFQVQGHGKTFSDVLKLGNIPIMDTLSNWNLKTKIKIAGSHMLITPISLESKLYHKFVNLSGSISQNFHDKSQISHINLRSGGSMVSAEIGHKPHEDVQIQAHGTGQNIADITKIFNSNLTSKQWDSDISLSMPAENNYKSVVINNMDSHIKFTKNIKITTHGKAELNYTNQHLGGNINLTYNSVPINLNLQNVNNKNILTFHSKGKDLNKIYKLGDMKFNTKAWSTSGRVILPYDWKNGVLSLQNMKTHIKTTSNFKLETLSDTKVYLKNLTTESNVKITSGKNNFYAKVIRDKNQSIIADITGQGKSLRNIFSFINNANLDVKWKINSNIVWNPKHGKSLFVKKINLNVGSSDVVGNIIIDGSQVFKKTDLPDILINLQSKNINLNDFKDKENDVHIKKKKAIKQKAKPKTLKKIFSKEKFDLEGIKKWHVKGNVHIDNFKKGLMTINNANMYVTSDKGIITAKGKIFINKGYADALVRLNTQSAYPQLKVIMNIKDMSLEEINKSIGINKMIRGALLNTKINLFTFGKSSYEMASHLNGIIQSTLGSGEIGSTLLNFASADLITSPLTILTGISKYKKLICGAVNLQIKHGKISGAPLLALKTQGIDIALSGQTNIAQENLNTRLIIYSRKGLGVSLTNLTGGYAIKGDYNNIYFGKTFTDILAIGAKSTATWFTFGIYPLAESLFKKTQNTENVCRLVMKNH